SRADAQDATAKLQGRIGQARFWSPDVGRVPERMYYSPESRMPLASPAEDGYRSFSYAPIRLRAGDRGEVKSGSAKMMLGADVVGTVPSGVEFTVTKVINGWVGTRVEVDGEMLKGWIWHRNVERVADSDSQDN